MGWRARLRDLVLAGGAFAVTSGCSSTPLVGGGTDAPPVSAKDATQDAPRDLAIDYAGHIGLGPCGGNAAPDPCMCGRPDMGSYFVTQCEEEKACQAQGGRWDVTFINIPGTCVGGAVDGSSAVGIDAAGGDGALDR